MVTRIARFMGTAALVALGAACGGGDFGRGVAVDDDGECASDSPACGGEEFGPYGDSDYGRWGSGAPFAKDGVDGATPDEGAGDVAPMPRTRLAPPPRLPNGR